MHDCLERQKTKAAEDDYSMGKAIFSQDSQISA